MDYHNIRGKSVWGGLLNLVLFLVEICTHALCIAGVHVVHLKTRSYRWKQFVQEIHTQRMSENWFTKHTGVQGTDLILSSTIRALFDVTNKKTNNPYEDHGKHFVSVHSLYYIFICKPSINVGFVNKVVM